jgi:hypothetical protein
VWPADGSLCTRLPNARRCPAVVRRHFKYGEVDIIKRRCSSLPLSPAWARGPALLVLPSRTLAAECRGRWTGSCVPSTSAFANAPTLIRVDAGARSGLPQCPESAAATALAATVTGSDSPPGGGPHVSLSTAARRGPGLLRAIPLLSLPGRGRRLLARPACQRARMCLAGQLAERRHVTWLISVT